VIDINWKVFLRVSGTIKTVRIIKELMEIWPNEVCDTLFISCILLIQLLYGLCTIFPHFSYDLILWHSIHVTITMWYLWYNTFPHFLYVVSPKEKKRKRNINNNLAVLLSHDKWILSGHQFSPQMVPSSSFSKEQVQRKHTVVVILLIHKCTNMLPQRAMRNKVDRWHYDNISERC